MYSTRIRLKTHRLRNVKEKKKAKCFCFFLLEAMQSLEGCIIMLTWRDTHLIVV